MSSQYIDYLLRGDAMTLFRKLIILSAVYKLSKLVDYISAAELRSISPMIIAGHECHSSTIAHVLTKLRKFKATERVRNSVGDVEGWHLNRAQLKQLIIAARNEFSFLDEVLEDDNNGSPER